MNKQKLSMKIEVWPAVDRRALEAAFSKGTRLFAKVGLAFHWRPATRKKVKKSYGAFMHCLKRYDLLTEVACPSARMTQANIILFVEDMEKRAVSSVTVASVMRDLHEAIRVMCPGALRQDLLFASRTLACRAEPSRDQRDQLIAPSTLFFAGIKRMKRFKALAASDPKAAAKYGDGLMMSMEAIKALRLGNLSGMLVDSNIVVNQLDEYEFRYEPHETKTRARIRAPLPAKLAPWIEHWLTVIRPSLLRVAGRESRAMWLTTKGTDMKPITLYYRFCKATKEETRKRINPHFCRAIAVTGIAIGATEMIELAPEALDHTSRRHTQDAYNLADDLAASRKVVDIMQRRRAAAIKRLKA